ncbi:sigma-70 family RNA polymerase sigma factor [Mycetocola saprophilus]|uniref:sigma-70 family RNA polymerase sigma factor n=1 Tax=Mycetocola saprophilus TaxID=76636 RepID=UPI0004C0EAA5|nr:sigma-70 family RNA polymerase sigma factor [Mycetocola saprophilus]
MSTEHEARVLRELHEQHGAVIWRFVVRLTGDFAGADDIVQETLLRAWRNPRIMSDDPESARSWLYTVARNLVVDEARSARRRHEIGVEEMPEGRSDDHTDALFDSILVAEALAALSGEHRAVVTGAYFGGRSTVELSADLGIPEGTVKSRLHYGLRALKLALQEKGVTR